MSSLNNRNELISCCRDSRKFLLKNVTTYLFAVASRPWSRQETIKKTISLIDGWIHGWTWSRKQWMRKSWIFTVSSNMANDSFNLFVSIFVSFSINSWKENAENLNYYPILRRKVELYLFLSTHREWESFFVASWDNSGYDQGERKGERCLSAVFFTFLFSP